MTSGGGSPGLSRLAELAAGLVVDGRRVVLGVAGAPGAGKTTFVEALIAQVARTRGADWVAHLPMDGFHLADVQLRGLGALSRKGAPDTFDVAGYAHLLERVRSHPDEVIYVPGFERTLEQPLAASLVIAPSAKLVVTEGNYLLLDQEPWIRARAQLHQVWYVAADDEVRVSRLIDRHVQFGKSRDDATEWVMGSDETNAALVVGSADRADRLVVNSPRGWLTTDA
ncbi:nucleoside/nucleotide kinase family protein [Intrasporangium mesophilum]